MKQRIDILAVGDVVTDAFIRLNQHEAEIDKDPVDKHPLLCMTYGSKVPFDEVIVIPAVGNSANAAVSFARLGLHSALYANIGDDDYGREMVRALSHEKVSTEFIRTSHGKASNYHYVLWYKDDRTILIKHEAYDYKWPQINQYQMPRWVYLSSVASGTEQFHKDLAKWLEDNPSVKLAFQPGTFQMRTGVEKLKKLYARSELFAVNKEEAQFVTGLETDNIRKLLEKLHSYGPKIVLITDGPKGSYASDGKQVLQMRDYPDPAPPYERTGAGDAYTSTFTAALAMGKDIKTALRWAPINPMGVVQKVGAQAGLLTKQELLNYLDQAPRDYEPKPL